MTAALLSTAKHHDLTSLVRRLLTGMKLITHGSGQLASNTSTQTDLRLMASYSSWQRR